MIVLHFIDFVSIFNQVLDRLNEPDVSIGLLKKKKKHFRFWAIRKSAETLCSIKMDRRPFESHFDQLIATKKTGNGRS